MSTAARTLTHLDELEAEAIHILREVAAEFERPALLFSGGKDSAVLLRLAERAFRPARLPFPLMHVDTGHNFPEVIEFRDKRVAELGARLIVASVPEAIERGLPVNPLHRQGYSSIGCTHCTAPGAGREGRWSGMEKVECGLHVVRT